MWTHIPHHASNTSIFLMDYCVQLQGLFYLLFFFFKIDRGNATMWSDLFKTVAQQISSHPVTEAGSWVEPGN